MKRNRILLILFLAMMHFATAKGQCDMLIDYAVEGIPSTTHGTLSMLLPDGKSTILFDGTVRQMQKTIHLEQLGEYWLTAVFFSALSGKDSLERRFILTGEEYKVETSARFERKRRN